MPVNAFYKIGNQQGLNKVVFTDYEFTENVIRNEFKPFVIEIKENVNCEIIFQGDQNAKIYIDNIKATNVHDAVLLKDEKEMYYFHPNDINISFEQCSKFYIYKNDNKNIISGYGPGYYRIKVVEAGEEAHFAYFQVDPKFLSDHELHEMRVEVENIVLGMARSFEAINNGVLLSENSAKNYDFLQKISLLHESKVHFKRSIYQINHSPRVDIEKIYRWSHVVHNTNDYTNRIAVTRPNYDERLYSFKRSITTDIYDNQVLKYELIYLKRSVFALLKELKKIRRSAGGKNASSLKSDEEILNEYIILIGDILDSENFKGVMVKRGSLSHSAMMDHTYSLIDRLFRKISNLRNQGNNTLVRQYVYDWIKTQDLYEIWGFVKTVQELVQLGFSPVSGWIFDKDFDNPFTLEHGTTVCFELEKDGELIKAQIKYNESIPQKPHKEALLWTTGEHNKPDIVIIIQDRDGSVQSILVLDTKYRELNHVYSSKKYQLQDYKQDIMPTQINKKLEALTITDYVSGVAILYPRKEEHSIAPSYIQSLRISSIELHPDGDSSALREFVINGLNYAIKRINWINTDKNDISFFSNL